MSRRIDEIYIHCSATQADWMEGRTADEKVAEIDRWHKKRGWSGIGYHWIVDRDGTTVAGRPEERVGAHCFDHNKHSIGICLLGGHGSDAGDAFADHFTPEQESALKTLLGDLQRRYGHARVRGHNEVAARACPGFNVPAWLANSGRPESNPGRRAVVAARTVDPEGRKSIAGSTTLRAGGAVKLATAATPVVAAVGGLPWQNLAIIAALAAGVLLASGYIDLERLRKWRAGVR